MKRLKLKRGKEELTSTGGNYLCGLLLSAVSGLLPKNFQKRRRDAISDRSLLKCLIGMLCNGRTDFTDINQYQDDTVFANAFEVERLPSESLLRQRLDELPPERSHEALRAVNTELLRKQSFGTLQPERNP